MKPHRLSTSLPRFLAAVILTSLPHASAADLTWDLTPGTVGVGNGTLTGGAGTWNTTNGNWTVDGGDTNIAWVSGSNVAVFSGSPGVVNLGGAITAGGLTFESTGYSVTGNTLTLAGTPVLTVGLGFSATIASVVDGTAGLMKSGPGTLTLGAPNTHTGSTTVTNGILSLEGNRTANSGSFIIGNTATQAATLNISNGNFSTGTGDFQIGTAVGSAVGVVQQSAGIVSTASTGTNNGRVLIGSAVASSGTYHLSGGSLTITAAGSTSLNNANTLVLGTNSDSTATFNLSGTGSLEIPQALGYLQIGRSNSTATSTSGTFNQTGGTAIVTNLGMGGASNTGTASILNLTGGDFSVTTSFATMAAGAGSSAEITIAGSAYVVMPGFPTARGAGSTATLTFDGGTLRPVASDSAYISGLDSATIKTGGVTFAVTTDKEITVPQPLLADTVSTGGGLTKTGLGGLELSGINTYQGPTLVSGGSLIISGEIHATSAVTVSSGATLGGSGSAPGTITSPGTIAPTATLSTGATDLANGTLAIEVSGASAGRLLSSGTISLSNTALTVSETAPATAASYVIAEGSAINGTFTSPSLPAGYSLDYTTTQVILKFALTVTNYDTWSAVNGLDPATDGPDMDPDHDQLDNLMEYILGGIPTGSGAGDQSMLPSSGIDETYFYFNYDRLEVSKQDTIQAVSISTDLVDWSGSPAVGTSSEGAVSIVPNSDTEAVSVAIPRSLASDGKLFARLEAAANFPIIAEEPGMMEILRYWAPVVYQEVRENTDLGRQLYGARDTFVAMNFDGDWDVANNWHNSRYQPDEQGQLVDRLTPPLHGKAYSAVVESEGFLFLTYGFYHSGQDSAFSAARHQNDWETVVLAVRKDATRFGTLEGMMTQFHTDQFSYLPSQITFSEHRPIIYIEPNGGLEGHGIKAYTNQNPGSQRSGLHPRRLLQNVTTTSLSTSGNWNTAPRFQYNLVPISEMWGLIGETGLNDPYAGWKLYNYARPANYPDYEHEAAGGNPPWDRDFFEEPFVFFSTNFPNLAPDLATDSYIYNPYLNGASNQSGPNNPNSLLPSSTWQKTQLGGTSGFAWHHRGETTLYHRSVSAADDRFTFSHTAASGDSVIQGRVHSVQDITNSRAGLMIRNSTADTSRMLGLLVSADQQVLLQYRTTDGGSLSAIVAGPIPTNDAPVWLRLERQGGDIIASYSYQELGGQFTVLATVPIAMDNEVRTGMAMRSNNADYYSSATLSNLEVKAP